MNPVQHMILSGVTSAVFGACTHSVAGTALCFVSGVAIDIDHWFDYIISKKRVTLRYRDLYSYCAREKKGTLILLFHSYELLALLWAAVFFFHFPVLLTGIIVGMTVHVIGDQLVNPLRPCVLFFYYRIKHRFEKEYMYPEEYYKKMI